MSDEQFLARWSRRKHDAKAGHAELAPDEAAEAQRSAFPDPAAEPVSSETELSDLPAIESIDAATDITAFLRKGIPQELSREALRRAWSTDPAIRDFVGLAENAWDFNDPNAMAGFGRLDYSPEQVDALVRRIVRGVVQTAESLPEPLADTSSDPARSARAEGGFAQSSNPVKTMADPRPLDESATAELPSNSVASQPVSSSEETSLPRRTHGGALPR
jgi:hypothetical protein